MNEIIAILEDINPGVDYENETALIDDGLLDSFNVIAIVMELNSKYGIKISINDMEPGNFNSVQAMYALVKRYQDAD